MPELQYPQAPGEYEAVLGYVSGALAESLPGFRGPLVAVLGALARSADDVESRLAAAKAAAVSACRDLWALGAQLARVADIAARPGSVLAAVRRDADVGHLSGQSLPPPIVLPCELTLVPPAVHSFDDVAFALRHCCYC